MKRLILYLLLMLVGLTATSQVAYRKYDKYLDRDEFFDRSGTRLGYAKYDKYMGRTVYYDNSGNIVKYEKEDKYMNRVEIIDKNYNRIGYKKWDKYLNRWEVYDKNGKMTMYYKWDKLYVFLKYIQKKMMMDLSVLNAEKKFQLVTHSALNAEQN